MRMVITKSAPVSKEKALSLVYDFYHQLQTWVSTEKVPAQNEIERYLSHNFKLTSNGNTLCKSSSEYLNRIKKFQERFSRFEFSKPLEEPVVNGNEIAIYYKVDLTPRKGGGSKQVFILAIGAIEDNHIVHWTQVAHEKGASEWDK